MKKATLLALLLGLATTTAYSQAGNPKKEDAQKKVSDAFSKRDLKGDFQEGWNKSTQFGANFNLSGFNGGWKTVNTGVEGNTMLNFVLNHKNAKLWGKNIWVNDFQGNLGFVKQGGSEFNRNVDKLFLNSMYGRKVSEKISAYGEANFISQFLNVKKDLEIMNPDSTQGVLPNVHRSGFLNPGYLTVSTGIEYRPKDYLSIKFAPVANRWTFVTNKNIHTEDGHAYGVNVAAGKKSISEFGSQVTVGFNKEVVKNVNLGFRYNMFQAWEQEEIIKQDKSIKKQLKSPNQRLDLVATASINKYLNVNFTLIAVQEDAALRDKWQIANGFGVGFLANL